MIKLLNLQSYDIVVFIIFFLFLHTILFMLHTLVLFIKDMTMYSKMELEREFDQMLVEYYNNSEQIIQKLVEENKCLKKQRSTFDKLREENSFKKKFIAK